ncbi:MAG: peptidylprolyl isomerase [Tepidisphaeraceae bacterium]
MSLSCRKTSSLALALVLLSGGGCASVNSFYNRVVGNTETQTVSPQQFEQAPPTAGPSPSVTQQPAVADEGNPRERAQAGFQPVLPPLPATPTPSSDQPAGLDLNLLNTTQPSVVASTQPSGLSGAAPTTLPTVAAAPTDTAPSLATGQYMPLGGVIAEVNGTPIYVNKVLQMVWPSLRNDAKLYDAEQFAEDAKNLIEREVVVEATDEKFFAAAERSLDDSDKKLVTAITAHWRQDQITQAGGSIEVARRVAASNGDNFDQLVQDKYRYYMSLLYRQRKFTPLLAPTAQEMRQYYEQHMDHFSTAALAVIDVLGIDPSKLQTGTEQQDKQLAFDRAKQAHDRAAAGESFATLFKEFNNDPGIDVLSHGTGNLGSLRRGSLNIKEIEDAVWNLEPGHVTDVLDIGGVLYLGKLESRTEGVVQPFESEDVQNTIRDTIERERFTKLTDIESARLDQQSITSVDEQMVDTAVDMAVQNYKFWNSENGAPATTAPSASVQ